MKPPRRFPFNPVTGDLICWPNYWKDDGVDHSKDAYHPQVWREAPDFTATLEFRYFEPSATSAVAVLKDIATGASYHMGLHSFENLFLDWAFHSTGGTPCVTGVWHVRQRGTAFFIEPLVTP